MKISTTTTSRWLTGLAAGLLLGAAAGTRAAAAERARLTVPRLERPPVLDGQMAPGEWDRAAAVTGFIGAGGPDGGRLSSPDATIFLAHDGEFIYLAVRTELLPGMVPSRKFRRRDEPVYMDSNQVEFWLTPPADGLDVTFQTIVNAYGAIFDIRSVPALGNEMLAWNGDWEVANRFERGKEWLIELRVPFESFDGAGFDPEREWGGLVAVAWPQRSWPYTGGWYKNYQNHARFRFADSGTCVRLAGMNSLFGNVLEPALELINDGKTEGVFTVRFEVGEMVVEERITVPAGRSAPFTFRRELPPAAGKEARVCKARVTGPAGELLLAGEWAFVPEDLSQRPARQAPEPARPFATRLQFGPETLGLQMWADLLDYPRREEIDQVRFTVRPQTEGGEAAPLEVATVREFEYDAAETMVWLSGQVMQPGPYEVVTAFLAADGSVLDSKTDGFRHVDLAKEFRWYNNAIGEARKQAPPFEPVGVGEPAPGRIFSVWGREYRLDGALPAQIASQGKEMLAAPIALKAVVDGTVVTATVKAPLAVGETTPERVDFTGSYELPGVVVRLAGAIEMDGVLLYDLTAEVTDAGQQATIERLYLSIPVKAECAETFYSTGGGWSGAYGVIPAEDGTAWTSAETSDFVPYVGLTDDQRAIQWFADHDHDWALGQDAPCAAVVRAGATVEIQVNFVRSRDWNGALAARFGLVATPVKPLPSGWRNTSLDNRRWYDANIQFFYGEGHGGCTIDPHDTPKLAKAIGLEIEGKSPFEIDDLLASTPPRPWTDERVAAMVESQKLPKDKVGNLWKAHQQPGGNCYFFNASMYFEGTRSAAFRLFFPAEWSFHPSGGWFHGTPTESFRDFFAFHMDIWAKHWFFGGLYFDETYYPFDYNVFNGSGKVMADGTVRGSVPLLRQRELMWRMWQIFHDNDHDPFIWIHTSNFMAPHAYSVADIAMFGEDRAPNPVTDYIDNTPAVLLRSIGRSQKFGFIPVWMDQAGRGGYHQGSRQLWGWVWLHDAVPEYHTNQFTMPTLGMRVAWGIAEDDVEFLPYWNNPAVATGDEQLLASVWTRPGKAMIMVLNLNKGAGNQPVKLHIDGAKLGLPKDFKVYDLESKPEVVDARAAVQAWAAAAATPEAATLIRTVYAKTRTEEPFKTYRLDELKAVGDAAVTIDVPPRDWVLLIAE